MGKFDVNAGAEQLMHDPIAFCRFLNSDSKESRVITWRWEVDTRRTVMVPPGYCLLVLAHRSFRADIRKTDGDIIETMGYEESLPMESGMFFAIFPPMQTQSFHQMLSFRIRVFENGNTHEHSSSLLYLGYPRTLTFQAHFSRQKIMSDPSLKFLDVNGRGGMLRGAAWWGRLESRYDGLLCANLNPEFPENRWMFLARYRIWAVYQGYSRELTLDCLETFSCPHDGGGGRWRFNVPTCEGRHFIIELVLWMPHGRNQVFLKITRMAAKDHALFLEDDVPVTLILRPDIEDRSFHDTVKAWTGPEDAWESALVSRSDGVRFEPVPGQRGLDLHMEGSQFIFEPEWTYMVHHPLEEERGLDAHSDLFSPGYFRISILGRAVFMIKADADLFNAHTKDPTPEISQGIAKGLVSSHFMEEVARNLGYLFGK